jgi:hypothetical protein
MMRSLILSLSLSAGLLAGVGRAADADNANLWLNYVGDHPIGDGPWGVHLEMQNRLSEWGEDWQQVLFRTGINYQIDPKMSVSLGYAFVETFPYGELPAAAAFDEHRIYEQFGCKDSWMGLDWQHRFRLEQRFIEDLAAADWRPENRIRYMLRTAVPLTEDKSWYIAMWDEVFLNFGGNLDNNHFDQNRAFAGIGHKLDKFTALEVGFLEQTLQKRGGANWENNHTVAVWLTSNWSPGKE